MRAVGEEQIKELQVLRETNGQLESDNRELTKHVKMLIEAHSQSDHIALYKQKINMLE